MLEGKNVNLRVMEKEDLPLFAEWLSLPWHTDVWPVFLVRVIKVAGWLKVG